MPQSHSANSDPKTLAILCWVLAPFTGFLWRDETTPLVRNHARESLYLGAFNMLTIGIILFFQICTAITIGIILEPLSLLVSCLWNIVWLVVLASIILPRAIGVIKAMNGETWIVPYVSEFMRQFIKL